MVTRVAFGPAKCRRSQSRWRISQRTSSRIPSFPRKRESRILECAQRQRRSGCPPARAWRMGRL